MFLSFQGKRRKNENISSETKSTEALVQTITALTRIELNMPTPDRPTTPTDEEGFKPLTRLESSNPSVLPYNPEDSHRNSSSNAKFCIEEKPLNEVQKEAFIKLYSDSIFCSYNKLEVSPDIYKKFGSDNLRERIAEIEANEQLIDDINNSSTTFFISENSFSKDSTEILDQIFIMDAEKIRSEMWLQDLLPRTKTTFELDKSTRIEAKAVKTLRELAKNNSELQNELDSAVKAYSHKAAEASADSIGKFSEEEFGGTNHLFYMKNQENNQMIGFVIFRFAKQNEKKITYLAEAGVKADEQGKGHLKEILDNLISHLTENKQEGVVFITRNFNVPTRNFLLRLSNLAQEKEVDLLLKSFDPESGKEENLSNKPEDFGYDSSKYMISPVLKLDAIKQVFQDINKKTEKFEKVTCITETPKILTEQEKSSSASRLSKWSKSESRS